VRVHDKEEREKGRGVQGGKGETVFREQGAHGGEKGGRDGGEGRAVEDGMESVPERGGVRAKGTEAEGIGTILTGGGGDVEVGREGGGLGAKPEEGEGRVVGEDTEIWGWSVEVAAL
jgi:hypothetical protein